MRDLRRPDQGQCRAGTPVAKAAERGHLAVFLHGHKLIGGYALTRIGPAGERWLLLKKPTNTLTERAIQSGASRNR